MRRDPRSTLTPAQQVIFDKFAGRKNAPIAEEVPLCVLRALEEQHRQATPQPFIVNRPEPPVGEFLTAAEAAGLLGVNLNTFARYAAKELEATRVDHRRVYRREDVEQWKRKQDETRKSSSNLKP